MERTTKHVCNRAFEDGLKFGELKCNFLVTKVYVIGYIVRDG
jgi:hypothetical protein